MAGIGIRLNRIFNNKNVSAALYGIGCSIGYTIAPMLFVIIALMGMEWALGFNQVNGTERELFSCTVLYIFIFSLVVTSPFNSVLSKYMTDKIYTEEYEDVRPCIFLGTALPLGLAILLGLPFLIYEYVIGHVEFYYVATSYWGFLSLVLVFAAMIYNSILKTYKKISIYFLSGTLLSFILALVFRYLLHFSITYSMLLALSIGLFVIGVLEMYNACRYFKISSGRYRPVLHYFRRYWQLLVANLCYTLGLFAHNFVFWTHPSHLVVANTFVCNQTYDMATCIAMFTNISATTVFISRQEMHVHERYAAYMSAIGGGKLDTIETCKSRLFRTLSTQLTSLVGLQFTLAVVIFLVAMVVMPILGASGLTIEIYPLLAAAYFIVFIYYPEMLYLYYFNDTTGAMVSSLVFVLVVLAGSFVSLHLSVIWYGTGFFLGSFAAFTYAYFRLRWLEKNIDRFILCRGSILKRGFGKKPTSLVYERNESYKKKGMN